MPLKRSEEEPKAERPIDTVVEHWNGVVEGLASAKRHWDSMQNILLGVSRMEIQSAPMMVQKVLGRFRKSRFEIMLDKFLPFYQTSGGLEGMRVKKGGAK